MFRTTAVDPKTRDLELETLLSKAVDKIFTRYQPYVNSTASGQLLRNHPLAEEANTNSNTYSPKWEQASGWSVNALTTIEEEHKQDIPDCNEFPPTQKLVPSYQGVAEPSELRWIASDRIYEPPVENSMRKETKHGGLTTIEAAQLDALLEEFKDIFSTHRWDLGTLDPKYGKGEVKILDHTPIEYKPPRFSWIERQWLKEDLAEMIKYNIISRDDLATGGCPCRYVPKPDGSRRFTCNFSAVNKRSETDAWPLPNIEECLFEMCHDGVGPRFFTAIDLSQSFFQVLLSEEAKKVLKTMTHDQVYTWNRLPMGYKGSPSQFCRCMHRVMKELPKDADGHPYHKTFIDDLLIYSKDFSSHLRHLRAVLQRLREANLKIRFKKSSFAFDSLTYLGFVVDREGIRVDPDKVAAVLKLKPPSTPAAMKSFNAMAGFFRGHLKGFAAATVPLKIRETVEGSKSPWSVEQLQAFDHIKKLLTEAPCLRRPRFDLPFHVHVDWSKHAIGAVLTQMDPDTGVEHPVRYASRICSGPESRLAPTHGEMLACIYALEKFKPYIFHRPFVVYTDHAALLALMSPTLKDPKLCRWSSRLDEFGDFVIRHRKGVLNVAPDCLSRSEVTAAIDCILTLLVLEEDGNPNWATDTLCPIADDLSSHQVQKQVKCAVCNHTEGEAEMTICDGCGECAHRACINPFAFRPIIGSFYCPKCDPEQANIVGAYYEDNTSLTYDKRDPYLDDELLAYLANPLTANKASAVAKRAERVRFHPHMEGFLQVRKRTGDSTHVWLTCPPVEYRRAIMAEAHEACGHGGRRLTLQALKENYIWHGATKDIKGHIRSCHPCQMDKAAMPLKAPPQEGAQYSPGQEWHVDLSGPHKFTVEDPNNPGKNREHSYYVLVMVERFSRWTELVVLPNKESESIAFGVYQGLLCRHGTPDIIVSDRGSEFTQHFHDLCLRFRILHKRTSAYNPQSNGVAEAQVKRLKKQLVRLAYDQPAAWIRLVPRAQFQMNTTVNSATGYTPYELIYGRKVISPPGIERFLPQPADSASPEFAFGVHALDVHTRHECAERLNNLRARLFTLEGRAAENSYKQQQRALKHSRKLWEKRAKQRASHATELPNVGDPVLILTPPTLIGTRKQNVAGPFLLIDVNDQTATLESGRNRSQDEKRWTCRYDRLVKYYFPP